MARIARVAAPGVSHHITQRGTNGTAAEMSMVSPEFLSVVVCLNDGTAFAHGAQLW